MPPGTVFMFSGQGANYYQMGRALFDHEPVFRESMLGLDERVRELAGLSVVEQLYGRGMDRSASFDRTLASHPAIFMVEYSLALLLLHEGVRPALTLGVSMGSFAAAVVAGFVTPEAALTAVVRQAQSFENACAPGGMLAVLGDPALCDEPPLAMSTELAAVNFASHFVISAPRAELERADTWLKGRGVATQSLPVSFAYHSKWIDAAQGEFERHERAMVRPVGTLPMVCCAAADFVPDNLCENFFWRAVRCPMRFRDAVARLESQNAYRYVDVGPAGTLATLLKYTLVPGSASTIHSVMTPYARDLDNLGALAGRRRT